MKPINPSTLFDDAAARGAPTLVHLDRPLDIAPAGGVTYDLEKLAGVVKEASGWLAAAGARPGDRVAIVKGNHWDFDLLSFGAVRLGAIPAKIRDDLAPEAVHLVLKRLAPSVLVTTAQSLRAARVAGTDLASLVPRVLSLDGPARGAVAIDDVRNDTPPPPQRRHDDEALLVCLTSGTTGIPKLVVHSTRTIIRQLAQFEARRTPLLGWRSGDTVASASAFSHGRTFCWTAVAFTATPRHLLIVSDHDPVRARAALSAHPPTILEALPSTYIRWVPISRAADNPFRNVRLYVSTYDAIHPPAVRAFLTASRRRHPVFLHGWGQSETGPLTFRFFTRRALAAEGDRHPTTRNQGRPIPGKIRVRVVDPGTLRRLPRGQVGVILARTKARCLGYLGEQERWDEKVDGSWLNTGDLGYATRVGNVVFLDREVDEVPGMSCVELEDVIDDRIPEVLECVILGRPGDLPVPVAVTVDGSLDRSRWRAATHDLPALGEPLVLTWDEVPRTGTGKVQRLDLREKVLAGTATYGTGRWT